MACFSVWDIQNCGCGSRFCAPCSGIGLPDTLTFSDVNQSGQSLNWSTSLPDFGYGYGTSGWLGPIVNVSKANIVTAAVAGSCAVPTVGTASLAYFVAYYCQPFSFVLATYFLGYTLSGGGYRPVKSTGSGTTLTPDAAIAAACWASQGFAEVSFATSATSSCSPFSITGTLASTGDIHGTSAPNGGAYTIAL